MSHPLATIDTLYAHTLLPSASNEAHHFLSNLFFESREGKLFIKTEKTTLPEEILDLARQENSPIVFENDECYLRRNFDLESSLAHNLARVAKNTKLSLCKPTPPSTLYPVQKDAFDAIFANKLVVITGGPGTGKTFLANCAIDALIAKNPNAKVIATAPTGKAAYRIKHAAAKTKTLHSLLNIRQGDDYTKSKQPIVCDLLLIDECSMIDIKLFKLVFESILPHTHVVLMGDPDQLPPVETGAIFNDLCNLDSIVSINLNETKRTDISSLKSLASAIRQGDATPALSLLKPLPQSPPILLDEKSVILTPYKKGALGSEMCNQAHLFYKKKPIMITQNDYKLSLMNGDIGVCEDGIATFTQGEEIKSYPMPLLSHYSYAFAISIHKSQGSEFDHVHLILPESDKSYTREMVYTAITRAKKQITIYATEKTFQEAIQSKQQSHSNIAKRFKECMST